MERPNLKICIENDRASESEDDKPILMDIGDESDDDSSSSESGSDSRSGRSRSRSVTSRSSRSGSNSGSSSSSGSDSGSESGMDDTLHVPTVEAHKQLPDPKRYKNKDGEFVTGFDLLSEEYQKKRENRAQRFDIKETTPTATDTDVRNLYKSLGLPTEDVEKGERGIRLDAVHVRGVDNMSTQDVFTYFREYGPGSLEWIDDTSCNVVWLEPASASRALLHLSAEIKDSTRPDRPRARRRTRSSVSMESAESMDTENIKMEQGLEDSGANKKKAVLDKDDPAEDDFDYDLNLMSDDDEDMKEDKEKVGSKGDEVKVEAGMDVQKRSDDQDPDSQPGKGQPKRAKDAETGELEIQDKDDASRRAGFNKITYEESECVPPGKWRKGVPFPPKAQHLYLRYATKADKKTVGAEKRSQYYRKFGNPNYMGMKGLISESRKRKIRASDYHEELAIAKKMVAKTKKFTGIPEKTAFDLHTEAAQKATTTAKPLYRKDDESGAAELQLKLDTFSEVEEELRAMLEVPPESPPPPPIARDKLVHTLEVDPQIQEILMRSQVQPQRQPLTVTRTRTHHKYSQPAAESEEEGEIFSSDDDADSRLTDNLDGSRSVDEELRELLDISPESPPVRKRYMKMYADDIEENKETNRTTRTKASVSSVHDRLSGVRKHTKDARSRIKGTRQDVHKIQPTGDLRSRLGRSANSHSYSRTSLHIQLDPD